MICAFVHSGVEVVGEREWNMRLLSHFNVYEYWAILWL